MKLRIKNLIIFFYILSNIACISGEIANFDPLEIIYNLTPIPEKPMVVVICSYNNEQWVEKNLSVYDQNYSNYRVLYVDDCSSDGTYQKVITLVEQKNQQHRTTVIHNENRRGPMANWYTAIHSCQDDEIIIQLDGDDWLYHPNVLAYINRLYSYEDIWMTYGQFIEYPSNIIGYEYSKPFSEEIIKNNSFRKVENLPMSHLRTCYAWLFKNIKIEDCLYEDNFYQMTCDKLICACTIELTGRRHKCIKIPLYVYNNRNPLSEHRISSELQAKLARHILSQKPYQPLQEKTSFDDIYNKRDKVLCIYFKSQHAVNAISDTPSDQNLNIFVKDLSMSGNDANDESYMINRKDLKQKLLNVLNATDCAYILLANDDIVQEKFSELSIWLDFLKKTQVDIFFAAINGDELPIYLLKNNKLLHIHFTEPIYGTYMKNFESIKDLLKIDFYLFNKDILNKFLRTGFDINNPDLIHNIQDWLIKKNYLILFQ